MRIGPQLYGFAGFDLTRPMTAGIGGLRVAQAPMTINNIASAADSQQTNGLAIDPPDPNDIANIAVPNDPTKLTKAQVTGLLYKRLADNLIVNTTPAIEQLLRINLSLFKSNLDLEG